MSKIKYWKHFDQQNLLSCFRGVFQNWNSDSISRKKPSHETSAKSQYKCKNTLTPVHVVDQSLTGLGENTTGLTNCRILKIWITIPSYLAFPPQFSEVTDFIIVCSAFWFLNDIEAAACEKPCLCGNVQAETRMGLESHLALLQSRLRRSPF